MRRTRTWQDVLVEAVVGVAVLVAVVEVFFGDHEGVLVGVVRAAFGV